MASLAFNLLHSIYLLFELINANTYGRAKLFPYVYTKNNYILSFKDYCKSENELM
jgi:hypothetical protein